MPLPKKLLIVYYNFPPVKVPGAVRIHHFYRAALPWFAEIHALAAANRRFFLQDPSLETGCQHIIEVPAWDLRRLAMRKKAGNAPFVSSALKGRPLIGWFRRLLDSFPFNILIGDGGLVYILAGYIRARRLIEEKGITHVFSTFRPYSDHIIGYLLKRRFPEVYWIADFRDLHVDPLRKNVLWPAFQRWCNRRILRRADLVTTVSEGLKRHLGKLAPRVYVLRNGMGAVGESGEGVVPFEKFTVVYTGALFEDKRDPCPLFSSLENMLKTKMLDPGQVQVLYAGQDGGRWMEYANRYNMGNITTTLGMLPLIKARDLQAKAHINLLLTYSSAELKGNLTSKLFEYFSARRPILAIVNGEQDEEMDELFRPLNEGLVFYTRNSDTTTITSFIGKYYHEWNTSGAVKSAFNENAFKQYEWPAMIAELMKFMGCNEAEYF